MSSNTKEDDMIFKIVNGNKIVFSNKDVAHLFYLIGDVRNFNLEELQKLPERPSPPKLNFTEEECRKQVLDELKKCFVPVKSRTNVEKYFCQAQCGRKFSLESNDFKIFHDGGSLDPMNSYVVCLRCYNDIAK